MPACLACQHFSLSFLIYIFVEDEHTLDALGRFHFGTAGRVLGALPLLKPDPLAAPPLPLLLPPEKPPPKVPPPPEPP
jgi:hypothetical protein